MLALRYVALLALTVWVGGLLALGGIAAPAIFDAAAAQPLADGRMLAGTIFGEVLRRFHLLSYVCGGLIVVSLLARAVLGPRPSRFALRSAVAVVMLAASAYSGMVVSARIERMRDALDVSPSSLPDTDPRRAAFGRMHGLSTGLQLIPVAGGLMLLFLELKD